MDCRVGLRPPRNDEIYSTSHDGTEGRTAAAGFPAFKNKKPASGFALLAMTRFFLQATMVPKAERPPPASRRSKNKKPASGFALLAMTRYVLKTSS